MDATLVSSNFDGLVAKFGELWDQSSGAPDVFSFLREHEATSDDEKLQVILLDQVRRSRIGRMIPAERYLAALPALAADKPLALEVVAGEFRLEWERLGQAPSADEFVSRFNDLSEDLRSRLEAEAERIHSPDSKTENLGFSIAASDPNLATSNWMGSDADESSPTARIDPSLSPAPARTTFGRYSVERVLGEGSQGVVYLALDGKLGRRVAIKVPHQHPAGSLSETEVFLHEARTLAMLDHPGIVPVYDVNSTENGYWYVVSKYIKGSNLARKIAQGRPSFAETAEVVASIAEALHYAHQQGLVHRDIKPANLLMDEQGRPCITDFGLALLAENFGKGPTRAGTPTYMSPEQARGEGHRVDGRSDVFSLGVVFYEMLTGKRPFVAEDQAELLRQIRTVEPAPPRQLDPLTPLELQRICLKALSKRASDRYRAAGEFADDLRHWLTAQSQLSTQFLPERSADGTMVVDGLTGSQLREALGPAKVVPKGLRSFDASDSEFFLQLLPGPHDRTGLPEHLRFWKVRIEETDPEKTFSVGLLYGPSGCGKSSLVKAGLLPRLSESVIPLYVEAAAEETEGRLMRGLRRICTDAPTDLNLPELISLIRRGRGLPLGKKIVIVLDQFEQWLHATRGKENTELVQALRQCDGGRIQCLVMARDDFAMAVTRFMRELEIPILEGVNFQTVDLFDVSHARKVLAEFGRAFLRLPENLGETTADQNSFLDESIKGLAQDGKVICVRLAVFAEMIKSKPWTPATLRAVGGAEGLDVTFLEETFGSRATNPAHLFHQRAVRGVLAILLPEQGSQIKGHMRSRKEMMLASGYKNRPKDFAELLRILDTELRLVTPTDPAGSFEPDESEKPAGEHEEFYQLTHDFLVPSLRDWLTRKRKETRKGRAELLLADRTAMWTARPENRALPTWLEWRTIKFHVPARDWSSAERALMRRANRYYRTRGLVLVLALVGVSVGGFETVGRLLADAKVDTLLRAESSDVNRTIEELAPLRRWGDPMLEERFAESEETSRAKLHAGIALLPIDPGKATFLKDRLLASSPRQFSMIRDSLKDHASSLSPDMWKLLGDHKADKGLRLRAACFLAAYEPQDARWSKSVQDLTEILVAQNLLDVPEWISNLKPVGAKLQQPLETVFHSRGKESEGDVAANALALFLADQPDRLVDLLRTAEPRQMRVLVDQLESNRERATALLEKMLPKPDQPAGAEPLTPAQSREQANAALALWSFGRGEKTWPLLRSGPDPTLRSQLVHLMAPAGVDPIVLIERFSSEPDATIRQAILLAIGEYPRDRIDPEDQEKLAAKLLELYRTDPSATVHSGVDWLLRSWGRGPQLDAIDELLAKEGLPVDRDWYVDVHGRTMIVFRNHVEFAIGAREGEDPKFTLDKPRHPMSIPRGFVISAKEITVEEFGAFLKAEVGVEEAEQLSAESQAQDPASAVSWYSAAKYCRWLSEEEGVVEEQMCFPAIENVTKARKLPADLLTRTGWRLPTEAEWEYACRGGAQTPFSCGDDLSLLPKFAWFLTDQTQGKSWPVGRLKPNAYGMFDVHGNVQEWCLDEPGAYRRSAGVKIKEDVLTPEELKMKDPDKRSQRGGSFADRPERIRSAFREGSPASSRSPTVGFRIARTLPE